MKSPLDGICRASLPLAALATLADLRRLPDVRATVAGERVWIQWAAGNEHVVRRVLAAPGVELYRERDGLWYRHGRSLPAFEVGADGDAMPLSRAITPCPIRAEEPPLAELIPSVLRIVRGARARRATGMSCELAELGTWAEQASSAQLASIRAARAAGVVLLLGRKLPQLPRAERFWGDLVLVPLGFQPEPDIPEDALREALEIPNEDLLVVRSGGVEVVPRDVFQPLSRAGIRRALME